MTPRCPDCGVTMESATARTGEGHRIYLHVPDDGDGGLLGSLFGGDRLGTETAFCPECGLTRLYADLGE